jgi:hypothetical protein
MPDTTKHSPVVLAIAAHRAIQDRIDAMEGNNPDQDEFDAACEAEDEAMQILIEEPCANDAEFLAKAAYIVAWEVRIMGADPEGGGAFANLALATQLHMKRRARSHLRLVEKEPARV